MLPSTSRKAFAAISLIALMLAGCSSPSSLRAAAASANDRRAAPDFSLMDANGAPIKLSGYRGKVVVLNFWATWCGPCKIEIPWFIEFEKTYRDRGFAILGVSMVEDGWGAVRPFVMQNAMNYTVTVGSGRVAQLYGGVESLPSTFLIDREGRIAYVHLGLVSKHEYEAEILKLVAQ
jgi:peroxiredoxin